MGNVLVYYLLILPISMLPYPLLYFLSDFTFIILYRVIGYRKNVVFNNIKNSFPEKTEPEQKEIMYKFYHHFCDLVFEGLKGFTVSKKEIHRRMKVRNPEVLSRFYKENKDIILVGGHYNNWEVFAAGLGLRTKYIPIGIYKPLKNKYFDKKMKDSRERFRLIMCPMKETKVYMEKDFGEPKATIFAIDQSPSNTKSCHWMTFLNQDTPVFYGAEKYAKEFNSPVVFGTIHKVKRGFYELEYDVICESPRETANDEITELNTKRLEKDIIEKPEFWLWTHRRWKHSRPVEA